jgi:Tfp pilus assembly protein PilW
VSLTETIVAMALTVALSGTVLSLVQAGHTIARTQPETADLQQRARLALQTLGTELRDAGAGLDRGSLAGPLVRYFPPVTPSIDGGVTIWTGTSADAQAMVATTAEQGTTMVVLRDSVGCLVGEAACAFVPDTSIIAFTADGCRTVLRVAAVSGGTFQLAAPLAGCTLAAGSAVMQGEVRTFRVDAAARQLIRRDEITGSSAPLLDNVAAMTATYFADAAGAEIVSGLTDADLKRVRRIRITLQFVASNPLLRIPDLTVAVDAAPRNMEGG